LSTLRQSLSRPATWIFILIGTAAFLLLLRTYVSVYVPEYGITKLIRIGEEFDRRGIAAYRATPKYIGPGDRWGFDGQYYAQIALDPLLRDPQIKGAVDNPPYRARRILLPWLAWIGGLGRPFWTLNVYAALNLVFWVGFAVLIGILFRPHGWAGLAGFAAMLMTCGIIESMHASLTDFPGFVLLTLAATVGGAGGAGCIALAALAREPNVLGIAALWDYRPPWLATARRNLWLGVIAAVPMLLWFAYVAWRFRMTAAVDGDNMAIPLQGIMAKLGEFSVLASHGQVHWEHWFTEFYTNDILHSLLTIIATLTQCVFLLTHREWGNRVWRMGVLFVPFFLCIGFPSWVSHFTVTRHALPITLAFNLVLAMRPRRAWLVWFILGNCFVPYGIYQFAVYDHGNPIAPERCAIVSSLPQTPAIRVSYPEGWSEPEWTRTHTWCWSVAKHSRLVINNPAATPVGVALVFSTRSINPRGLTVSVRGTPLWSGSFASARQPVETPVFLLEPGANAIDFETPQAPSPAEAGNDNRRLSFMLQDLQVRLSAPPAEPTAPGK